MNEVDLLTGIGWDLHRREQIRRWRKLPLGQKFQAVEALNETLRLIAEQRNKRQLPVRRPGK